MSGQESEPMPFEVRLGEELVAAARRTLGETTESTEHVDEVEQPTDASATRQPFEKAPIVTTHEPYWHKNSSQAE